MAKRKNRSSGATAYLALLATSGTAAYGIIQKNMTLMVISITVLTIYIYKIKGKK